MKRGVAVSVLWLFLGCESDSPGLASCAITLCNEDTNPTRYSGGERAYETACNAGCSDASLQALSLTTWQCVYQSSCRQLLEHDACHQGTSYSCM